MIFIAFPIDRRLLLLLSFPIATSILPQLRNVLYLLADIQIDNALPLAHIVEVCLLASSYTTLARKEEFVAIAKAIAASHVVGDPIIKRITLRRIVLSRISSYE